MNAPAPRPAESEGPVRTGGAAPVGAIWAQSPVGVIGQAGGIPWHLPEDLRHFAAVTAGAAAVMGRRTWDSLPERFRPLPGRLNLVQTRSSGWSAPGALPFAAVADAVRLAGERDIWVTGGRRVFDAWWGLIERAEVTVVDIEVDGDTWAPSLAEAQWQLVARDPGSGWHTSGNGIGYRFDSFRRIGGVDGRAPS
jgi:dihydrofolate reductase